MHNRESELLSKLSVLVCKMGMAVALLIGMSWELQEVLQ